MAACQNRYILHVKGCAKPREPPQPAPCAKGSHAGRQLNELCTSSLARRAWQQTCVEGIANSSTTSIAAL